MKGIAIMEYMTKKQLETLDINSLDEKTRSEIEKIKDELVLSDQGIMTFGNGAKKNLNEFSRNLLQKVKVKDNQEISDLLTDLMSELSTIDSTAVIGQKKSIFRKFRAFKDIQAFVSRYNNVADVIDSVKKKLEEEAYQLLKDVELLQSYIEKDYEYINELDIYIFAAELKLKEYEDKIKEMKRMIDESDMMAVQALGIEEGIKNRLSKKVYDLKLIRTNAILNIPQIRIIKDGDLAIIDAIQSSIDNSIPIWESQMVAIITLASQKKGTDMKRAVQNTTDNLVRVSSELVKTGAIAIAEEVQKGVIDMDALKYSSQNLMDTITEVRRINLEGMQKVEEGTKELGLINANLNKALLIEG